MSVDVSAKIGYGYIVSCDDHIDYRHKIDEIDDPNFMTLEDDYLWINAYCDNSDVFYGLFLDSTNTCTMINDDIASLIDEKEWGAFYSLFKTEFPEIAETTEPHFYLMCVWW